MLFGALGCNLAWGFIDAVFYLLGVLSERGHNLIIFRALQKAADPTDADRIVTDALPPVLVKILSTSEIQSMRQRLRQLPEPPKRPHLTRDDWLGATGVLLLVFLSTFPVAVPFIFFADLARAMRVSNSIAIVMLFLAGYALGNYSGYRPLRVGLFMVALGVAMVGLTIALGG
jgi:VIT1/CCC1 family predicted Fe2+/Mn2+ transporter